MIKNTFSLLLIVSISFSCSVKDIDGEGGLPEVKTKAEFNIENVEVVTIDSCEYIIIREDKDQNSSYGFMSHKGNCSNPIHR